MIRYSQVILFFFKRVMFQSLASKFAGPTAPIPPNQQRSRSTTSRHYSSSSYTSKTTSNAPQPGNRLAYMPTVTYSALPKSREPPVNSVEYYQMQMQQHGGQGYANIQQAAAPAHIQHAAESLGPILQQLRSTTTTTATSAKATATTTTTTAAEQTTWKFFNFIT